MKKLLRDALNIHLLYGLGEQEELDDSTIENVTEFIRTRFYSGKKRELCSNQSSVVPKRDNKNIDYDPTRSRFTYTGDQERNL